MDGKKYKLLIADDEYWTREKFRRMIHWEKYNIDFMEPAEDGEEVLARMEDTLPDILITDINMPIVNGVELMEVIKDKYPSVITLVVSGYDDFEYVKNTMKAGAINYLLKPVLKVELIQSVSEAMDLINQREAKALEDEQIRVELQRASSMLQDHEYSRLVDKNDATAMANLSMNINLESAGYSFVLLKIHDMTKAMNEFNQNINRLSYLVKKEIKDSLQEEDIIVFNHVTKSNEFIIISKQKKANSHQAAIKYITLLEKILQSPVTAVLSNYSYTLESLHHAYTQAISLLMTRKYMAKSEIVTQDTQTKKLQGEKRTKVLNDDLLNQLQIFIKLSNKDMVKKIVRENLETKEGADATYLDIKQTIRQINNLLMTQFPKEMDPADLIIMENLVDEADRKVESLNIKLLLQYEEEVIEHIMVSQPKEEPDSMQGTVKQVKEYIDLHYFEELSLSFFAEKYLADSSYLSKSFKQYTGENISIYIAKRKIDKSIDYIKENKLSLSEISFLVGFDDYTYFSRVFKKITGGSPREYKNHSLGI